MTRGLILAAVLGGGVVSCQKGSSQSGPLDQARLAREHPAAMQEIQRAIKEIVSPALQACGAEFDARKSLAGRIDYSVALTVTSAGGTGHFVAVEGHPSWPSEFDAPMKQCVRKAFSASSFSSETPFSLSVVYPMCLRHEGDGVPGRPAKTAGGPMQVTSETARERAKRPSSPPWSIRPADCPEAISGPGSPPFTEQFKTMSVKPGWSTERESEIRRYLDGLPVKAKLQVLQCKCPCCIVGVECENRAHCDDWMLKLQEGGRPPKTAFLRFASAPPAPEYSFTQDDKHIAVYVCY